MQPFALSVIHPFGDVTGAVRQTALDLHAYLHAYRVHGIGAIWLRAWLWFVAAGVRTRRTSLTVPMMLRLPCRCSPRTLLTLGAQFWPLHLGCTALQVKGMHVTTKKWLSLAATEEHFAGAPDPAEDAVLRSHVDLACGPPVPSRRRCVRHLHSSKKVGVLAPSAKPFLQFSTALFRSQDR